jgi:hypothetical protein
MKMHIHSEKMSMTMARKDGSGAKTRVLRSFEATFGIPWRVYEHRKDNGEIMTYVNHQTTEWSVKIMMTMLMAVNGEWLRYPFAV